MSYRSPARWLAPLALVGAAVAILVTVASSDSGPGGSTSASPTSTTPRPARTSRTSGAARRPTPARRTYTVEPGDVLTLIAEKTGVTLERLQALNPDVDAQSLHAGQKLKLAP